MTVQTWLTEHLKTYPEAQVMDVYKFLHQAVFGSSEAVSQPENTRDWLEFQWANHLRANTSPLLEPVGADWMRLHLYAYQQKNGDVEKLFHAVLRSAQAKQVDLGKMADYWREFEAMLKADKKLAERFSSREIHLLGKMYTAQHWSVPQHSPQFIRTYHPIYRLLTRTEAEQLCQGMI